MNERCFVKKISRTVLSKVFQGIDFRKVVAAAAVLPVFMVWFAFETPAWCKNPQKRISPRIIGGMDAETGTWPWIAAIIDANDTDPYSGHFCGGTLIHPKWVLTACHCMENETAQSVDVLLNTVDLKSDTGERIDVAQIIQHPSYNSVTMDNDIALIELASPSSAIPLNIHRTADLIEGENSITMGWGLLQPDGWIYPSILQQVNLPIVSNATCIDSFMNKGFPEDYITENMLCAGFAEGGKDACRGDSGGPLVVQRSDGYKLSGIVSWGEGCAEEGLYGVYTRVSLFASFIDAYVDSSYIGGKILADAAGHVSLPVADATIKINEFETRTDSRGFFFIDTDPGVYEITISAPLFVPIVQSVNVSGDGIVYLEKKMTPCPPGDINCDGRVGIEDAIGILKILTGLTD